MKRIGGFAAVWLVLLMLSACNLGATPSTPQPIRTPSPPSPHSTKPTLTLIAPRDGDEFIVNQPILVNVTASDSVGVTRVQLFANGSVVKTVSSNASSGDRTLSALLDFIPRTTGEVNLRVLAFRDSVASDPIDLRVMVKSSALPTVTPLAGGGSSGGGGFVPIIPNDGVCRVMTITGVNFRTSPTTTQGNNVIRVLAANTLAPVVGRLPDNTWWQINLDGTVGWVSAAFVSISGNCLNVPVQTFATPTPTATATLPPTATPNVPTNTPPPTTVQLPDLVVTNITGELNVTLSGGTATRTYSFTITNIGQVPTGQFAVTMSINNGAPVEIGVVGGLNAGQSIALTREITFNAAGIYVIRVDADPANQVTEVSDFNNRGDITVTVNN